MGVQERQQKEKLILDVAIRLFTEKGFAATTMDEVAKTAKISKGLTYFYFKNKEDLYLAMTKKAFDELKDVFRDIYKNKSRTGLDMITELANNYVRFARSSRIYYQAVLDFLGTVQQYNDENLRQKINPLILQSEHFQKLLEIHHDCAKIGAQMVAQGTKDGSIRAELNPEVAFYTVWAMLIGYEKLMGPVSYEPKDTKIQLETWKPGFTKLMQDMLKGTFQAVRVQPVQTSLF